MQRCNAYHYHYYYCTMVRMITTVGPSNYKKVRGRKKAGGGG